MTDSEFLRRAEEVLATVERTVERATDSGEIDVECSRSGNVLEIELVDQGSKIIVNSQSAMQEIWVAARSGGFHFRYADERGKWISTRDGSELFAVLADAIASQAGAPVKFEVPEN